MKELGYSKGETVVVDMDIYEWNTETPADPTGIGWEVYSPDNILMDSGTYPDNINRTGEGEYQFFWTLPSDAPDGIWKIKFIIYSGVNSVIEWVRFVCGE